MIHRFYKIIVIFAWLTLSALGCTLIATGSLYLYLSPKLPSSESLRQVKLQTPLRIYSQDLHLIGEFGEKRRNPITFEQIPLIYIQALLSAEDDRFYQHAGVDITSLLRAASELIATGEIQTGGSTITMQVARNYFLTRQQTFTRKFNEILLALRIEDELGKNEILTLYANKIYQGNRAYGIEAAAQVYYGTTIGNLNLAQVAMLAGLPKAPSAFNPIANPTRAMIRRNWILERMFELGHIDEAAYLLARNAPITASYHGYLPELDAPYIAEMARREVIDMVGLTAYTDGYRVITTVDSKLQQAAEQAVQDGLIAYDSRHGFRGPEKNLGEPEDWQTTLRETPTYGNLVPAVISEVKPQALIVQTEFAETLEISWENGLKGLRRYISPSNRSAAIKTADELFSVGDLIRIRRHQDTWQLSQLPKAQAAIVALDPENGAIQALIGGYDFRQSNFNRATQAERQPGSNFKPFIYTIALENGFTPASIINDAPVVFDDGSLEKSWRPENDGGKFFGPTRLRKALYLSRNLVSIRLMRSIGINRAVEGLQRFGFDKSRLPRDLSLALGSHAVTPLQIVTGYAALANGGYRVEPYLVDRIEDTSGSLLYRAAPMTVCRKDCDRQPESNRTDTTLDDTGADLPTHVADEEITDAHPPVTGQLYLPPPHAPRIIEPGIAYIMDSILKDVIVKGTGRRALALKRTDIAGKTGTTNGPKDAWFSGYSPHIVATAWLGFDQNLLLGRNEFGGSAALPIWMDFMRVALADKPEISRPQPEGVVMVRIDPDTGLRVGPDHSNAMFEIFREQDVPPLMNKDRSSDGGSDPSQGPRPEDLF